MDFNRKWYIKIIKKNAVNLLNILTVGSGFGDVFILSQSFEVLEILEV